VSGQELYCMVDAGYTPIQFVFGNVAYSVGLVGGILGGLKTLARGEIKEFSDVFNKTRHLALDRIAREAAQCGANAVVGIETKILPFAGTHEMLMIGTAASHPALPAPGTAAPVTSDLTCEEMWNLAAMGYMPMKLVLGTAVYSLGLVGGIKAMFKSIVRGEISDLTSLVYDAREHAIGLLRREAAEIGADDVVGIKTHIHDVGGVIEFMAVGTAVKRMPGATPQSPTLPVQAIIRDRRTWHSHTDLMRQGTNGNDSAHDGGDGGGD
ncbi:MAG: heavy metal-binding domain-containing protein, partial [Hyphomicrobiaceae bacterium]|nr:heavy metal-binding domain-containing protein [Hyphomicrobiaceae bacterium]